MLDPHEKHAFDDVVSQLYADDPQFLARIDRLSHPRHRLRKAMAILLWIIAPICAVVGGWTGFFMALVAVGALIGAAGAFAGSRLLSSVLDGVKAGDPLSLALATLALLIAGALAAYAPAHRASRVDPATVLREQ